MLKCRIIIVVLGNTGQTASYNHRRMANTCVGVQKINHC